MTNEGKMIYKRKGEQKKFMVRSDSLYRPRVEMKLTRSLLAVSVFTVFTVLLLYRSQ